MKIVLICFCFFFFISPSSVAAADPSRVVTIVHPVRSRTLWKNIEAMQNQLLAVTKDQLPVTWLIQYDVLSDQSVIQLLKKLPPDHEIGIFLEVDETLAGDAFVPYLQGDGDRARADKILLSGYEPAERKRMIDRVFTKFRDVFGYFPVSVGAWYIDALSSEYLSSVYSVQAMMDCSDQFQTDGYGLWGQPWGTAYYSSRLHPLVPANELADKLPIVKTQWAARDMVRGFGLTVANSIYSVQANDYAGQGLKTDYFEKLVKEYLWSPNRLNHLTVGIEVGQEGRSYLSEYQRQMEVLAGMRKRSEIEILTMKQFSNLYRHTFPELSPEMFVSGKDNNNEQVEGYWYSNPQYRVGLLKENGQLKIRDLRSYSQLLIDEGSMQRDTQQKLKRIIPAEIDESVLGNSRILLENVSAVTARRIDDKIVLDVALLNGENHTVKLEQAAILLDGQHVWSPQQKKNAGSRALRMLARGVLTYASWLPHRWTGGIRLSSIEGIWYAGLWIHPHNLYGVSTNFPYIGRYHFPFPVLSHFRSPGAIDPTVWIWKIIQT